VGEEVEMQFDTCFGSSPLLQRNNMRNPPAKGWNWSLRNSSQAH